MQLTLFTSVLLAVAPLAAAQQAGTVHPTVSSVMDRMTSAKWTERSKAFDEAARLVNLGKETAGDVDHLRLGLIQLLATENSEMRRPNGKARQAAGSSSNKDEAADEGGAEEYSEYYADLIGSVASLGDERAIPALLGAAATGGMATEGVARFGGKALDQVLSQARSQDTVLAHGAVFVIRKMLKMQTANDPNSQLRIKTALRSALGSPDFGVRDSALFAIEYLDQREEFVPMLKDIAQNDPVKFAGQKPDDRGDHGEFYPVRQQARSLLRKIANHEPPLIGKRVSQ